MFKKKKIKLLVHETDFFVGAEKVRQSCQRALDMGTEFGIVLTGRKDNQNMVILSRTEYDFYIPSDGKEKVMFKITDVILESKTNSKDPNCAKTYKVIASGIIVGN